jgi:hypothetical protein
LGLRLLLPLRLRPLVRRLFFFTRKLGSLTGLGVGTHAGISAAALSTTSSANIGRATTLSGTTS